MGNVMARQIEVRKEFYHCLSIEGVLGMNKALKLAFACVSQANVRLIGKKI